MGNIQKPYILTIDDDEDFNRLIKKVLKRIDVEVSTTTNAKEFITLLKAKKPDICIIDINLDKNYGAGFQIIQAIRNRLGHFTPLIVMSKRSGREDISTAFELGASDYISKPLDDVLLLTKIKHFLELSGKSQDFADSPLPYKEVSKAHRDCELLFNVQLQSITEFGINIISKNFLSRGTTLTLTHNIIQEATGIEKPLIMTVHDNWVDAENQRCGAYLEFDTSNEELLRRIRSWLVKKSSHSAQE